MLVAAAYKARGFGKSEGTVQGQAALIGGGDNSDDLPESLPRQAGQERLIQPAAYAAAARRIRSQKDGQLGKIAVACLGPEGFGAGVAQIAARLILCDQPGVEFQLAADFLRARLHAGVDLVKGGCGGKHVMAVGIMNKLCVLGRGDAKTDVHRPPPPS